MAIPTRAVALIAFAIFLLIGPQAQMRQAAAETSLAPLPALGIDLQQTSTSGISSGAYMAGQFQMAHGEVVVGTAIIAGGPYGCAESAFSSFFGNFWGSALNYNRAASACMANLMAIYGIPSPGVLANKARRRARAGKIAPIDSHHSDRVYLFSGTKDKFVRPGIVRAAARFYRELGLSDENVKFHDSLPAGHGFVTETEGPSCGVTAPPFVVDCDFDLAGALLSHIYGTLQPRGTQSDGTFITFDQTAFTENHRKSGLAIKGHLFVPEVCKRKTGCRAHVAYHGCDQNSAKVGDVFMTQSGLANWAVSNRIVLLFPQTRASAVNPLGCWDWWGYTGRAFLTREAPQIVAVRRMLERLAARP